MYKSLLSIVLLAFSSLGAYRLGADTPNAPIVASALSPTSGPLAPTAAVIGGNHGSAVIEQTLNTDGQTGNVAIFRISDVGAGVQYFTVFQTLPDDSGNGMKTMVTTLHAEANTGNCQVVCSAGPIAFTNN
jgi:hypothetical protein